MKSAEEGPPSNLVLFYIQAEFPSGDTRPEKSTWSKSQALSVAVRRTRLARSMLEQAFEMRSLIVMLDGIDEALLQRIHCSTQ